MEAFSRSSVSGTLTKVMSHPMATPGGQSIDDLVVLRRSDCKCLASPQSTRVRPFLLVTRTGCDRPTQRAC